MLPGAPRALCRLAQPRQTSTGCPQSAPTDKWCSWEMAPEGLSAQGSLHLPPPLQGLPTQPQQSAGQRRED